MSTLRPTVAGLLIVAILVGPVVGTVGAASGGPALSGGGPGADAAVGGAVVDDGITSVAHAGKADDLDNGTGDTLEGELNETETVEDDAESGTGNETGDDEGTIEEATDEIEETSNDTNESIDETVEDDETVDETTDTTDETVKDDGTVGDAVDDADETVEETADTADETVDTADETVDETTERLDPAVSGEVDGQLAVADHVSTAETPSVVGDVRETANATTQETTAATAETVAYLERETGDATGTADDLGSSPLVTLDDDAGDETSSDDDADSRDSADDSDDEAGAGWNDGSSSLLPSVDLPADLSEWAVLGSLAMLTAIGAAAAGSGLNVLSVATGVKTASLLAPAASLGPSALSAKFLNPVTTLSTRIARSLGVLSRLLGTAGPGYARHDGTDPLEHEDRNRIYKQIRESPGVFLSAVSDRTGIPLSTVRHHLKVLERERLVTTSKVRGKRRYYPHGTKNPDLAAALEDGVTADILERLVKVGPANVTSLAEELDRDPSTISHHLSQLEEDDLIDRERRGRSKVARATSAVVDEIEELTTEPRPRPATASSAD